MSIRTSIPRISRGGQVLLSDGFRHDAVETAIHIVEVRIAPASAVVTVAFVRPRPAC